MFKNFYSNQKAKRFTTDFERFVNHFFHQHVQNAIDLAHPPKSLKIYQHLKHLRTYHKF